MGSYLYSALDASGTRTVGRVEGDDIAHARAQLEAHALTDITFHTESFDAITGASGFESLPELEVRPEEELAARQQGLGGFFLTLRRNYLPILAPLLLWNAWSLYAGRPFGWGDGLGFALTVTLVAFLVWVVFPVVAFNRLLAANAWARWNDARRIVGWMRRMPGPSRLAPHQLDFYEAKALIGLGRRDEGFARYERWEGDSTLPRELFVGMMSALHDVAREHAAQLGRHREMLELIPDSAQPWIDIAALLARRGGQQEQAIAALAEGDLREQTPLVAAYADYVRGILAIDAAQSREAAHLLIAAMDGIRAVGDNPQLHELRALIQGYLAIALLQMRRRDDAGRLWRAVLPRLQVLGCDEVVGRYAAAAIGRAWQPFDDVVPRSAESDAAAR